MRTRLLNWLIPLLLLGAAAYALAEEMTLTTYYPSPRGVYKELRTTDNTYLATDGGRVGIGTGDPQAKLDVAGQLNATRLCISGDCQGSWPHFYNGNKPTCPADYPNLISRDWNTGNTGALCGAEGGGSCNYVGGFGEKPLADPAGSQYCCISGCNLCQPAIDELVTAGNIGWSSVACSK